MPRRRAPLSMARLTGADMRSPGRYRDRSEPAPTGKLGPPPDRLSDAEAAIWREIAADLPWLARSDRLMLENAVRLTHRARTEPDCPLGIFTQLRLSLSAMGATPTDRSRVTLPTDDDRDDPASEFFQ